MAQLAPPASCVPQVSDSVNGPLTAMAIPVSGRSPVFVNGTVWAGDSCPTTTPPKPSDVAGRLSVGAAQPKPLSATVWIPAPSVKVSVPEAAPRWVGANSNCIWQSACGCSVLEPHELLKMVNGGVMATPVMETAALPAFWTATEIGRAHV